jgi:MoxR-like ATPase
MREEIKKIQGLMESADYVTDAAIATSVHLAMTLKKPLLIEGHAGVGKTEVAKVLARTLSRKLIRLQCYEGLDLASAAYEWNYQRQMLEIRIAEAAHEDRARIEHDLFSERFLVKRPLLQALEPDPAGPPVLLIDEIDRTDEPFEAFLLEVLSDFQVTIPEIGPVRAAAPPLAVITSNRTREVHDALKRRCFYAWIDYPDAARELAILELKVPQAAERLAREVVGFVQRLRAKDLFKLPGVAETLDWTRALIAMDRSALDPATVDATLGVVLKYQDDIARVRGPEAEAILRAAVGEAAAP